MMTSLKLLRPRNIFGIFCILAACSFFGVSIAQKQPVKKSNTAPEASSDGGANPIVIKTSKEEVTLAEFEAAYRRMNDKDPYGTTLDSLKDFLTIYADYRLKL